MARFTLTRRTMLRGLLGGAAVSIALPPLEAMMDANGLAYADGPPPPPPPPEPEPEEPRRRRRR